MMQKRHGVAIAIAGTDQEIDLCYPVMAELRPAYTQESFRKRVRLQQASSFELVMLTDGGDARACAGIRIIENLAWGRFLYVDDLVTAAVFRSCGYGDALMDWLVDYARANGCGQLHLDSGVQRFEAHRFYLRKRLLITCHHFAISL